jgi:hypothetical protein
LQEMYAPQFSAKDQTSGYGLGIYKAIQNNTIRLSHGGLGYGISAHYRIVPEAPDWRGSHDKSGRGPQRTRFGKPHHRVDARRETGHIAKKPIAKPYR